MSTAYVSSSNDSSPSTNQPCYFLNERQTMKFQSGEGSSPSTEPRSGSMKTNTSGMGGILQFSIPNTNTQWITTGKHTGYSSVSPTSKLHFEHLPKDVHRVTAEEVELLMDNELIIFDIRPFNLYSVSRVKGAINLCVPTTLLKRTSFNIPQMLNSISMPPDLKSLTILKISASSSNKPVSVLVYDSESDDNHTSFLLYTTCMKFLQYNKDDFKAFEIYYLDGGFSSIKEQAKIVERNVSAPSIVASPNINQLCSFSGFQLPSCTPANQKFLSNIKKNNLPKLIINDKTKNLNDKDNYNDNENLDDYPYNFRLPNISQEQIEKLPKWLQFLVKSANTHKDSNSIIRIINSQFNKIEKSEQARLKTAIANQCSKDHVPNICSPSALCPGCDNTYYKIPKGIEYGFKNRYNNIWPYEHSRVKLVKSPNPLKLDDYDDYFNANYINFPRVSNLKYIATQNPLQATYEDFWKTIWYNHINIIICLNAQLPANLVGQDKKYFDDQIFSKSDIQIKNNEIIQEKYYNIRKLALTKNGITKLVYHLEYKDWPDFGVPTSFESIGELIELKKKLIKKEGLNEQTLVHCLAGCGRTGCFITLDMILDCFHNYKEGDFDPWGSDDLIYKTVQYQRTQRISMVQNLDQFIFCYEFVLNYVVRNLI